MYDEFTSQIDKKALLAQMHEKKKELQRQANLAEAPHKKAIAAHVHHVARVLRKAADEIEEGKLALYEGRWCKVKDIIVQRVGNVPEDATELLDLIAGYEAAIAQIQHAPSGEFTVTTSQVKRWLSGEISRTSVRRRR